MKDFNSRPAIIIFGLLFIFATGCTSTPRTVDVPIATPCPERPHIDKPVYDIIPDDAPHDMTVVMSYKNRLKMAKYIAQLEKAKGC